MPYEAALTVRYWGTTGSIPRPLPPDALTARLAAALLQLRQQGLWDAWMALPATPDAALAFLAQHLPTSVRLTAGGNSTCIEIEAGDQLLLVDAGSGLRAWSTAVQRRRGTATSSEESPVHTHLFLTHAHLDHLVGISSCDVFFQPRNETTIWASAAVIHRLHELLQRPEQQRGPLAGVTLRQLASIRNWNVLEHNALLQIGDTQVQVRACNHPGEALAYRFDRAGCCVVVATDHEQITTPDEGLAEFASHADLVYMDAQYTRAEYEGLEGIGGGKPQPRRGWGHSTVESCVETALRARCHRLHLGHHEPQRDDAGLDALEQQARRYLAEQLNARESHGIALEVSLAREGDVFPLFPHDSPGARPCPAE